HIPTIAYAYLHAALFELIRRDHLRSAPHVRAYVDLAREHVMPMWTANGAFHEAWVRWRAGDHHHTLEQMRAAFALLREQGQGVVMPLHGVLLADAEGKAGHYDAAFAAIGAGLAEITESGQGWFDAEAHKAHGELLLSAHPADADAAEREFTRAIGVARRQSAKLFELRAATSLARLWSEQGRRGGAGAAGAGLRLVHRRLRIGRFARDARGPGRTRRGEAIA